MTTSFERTAVEGNECAISSELMALATQKCRHEYGHHIAARVLGFRTGEVTFQLLNATGDHVGAAEVMVHMPLTENAALISYIERRIVLLFSGVMAEVPLGERVGGSYVEEMLSVGSGGSDLAKITELVELHLNLSAPGAMEVPLRLSARQALMRRLRRRSAEIVQAEHALIAELASEHANSLVKVTRGWAWGFSGDELDAKPQVKLRFPKHGQNMLEKST